MILDPNGMPILQPTVDNAETATFNDAFAAIGNTRQIKTYKWADNAARTAQTGMVAGDEGYQTDTGTLYTYDGTSWEILVGDTGWITPTVLNSWIQNDPVKYRRLNGVVYIVGRVTGGSGTIFNLPVGFRPTIRAILQVADGTDPTTTTRIIVNPSGDVDGLTSTNPTVAGIAPFIPDA